MYNLIKRLMCKHKSIEFIRNVYGDEINVLSSDRMIVRSIWKCKNCGKIIYKGRLNDKL